MDYPPTIEFHMDPIVIIHIINDHKVGIQVEFSISSQVHGNI